MTLSSPAAQQFRRALHAKLPQALRDGLAGLRGKNAAQIKMAATDLAPQFLQRRRLGEILFQQKDDLLDALLREPLLARAEHFLFRRRLEQKRHGEFQRLALIPERLRRRINRRLPQRGDELLLAGREANGGSRNQFTRTILHGRPHERMQHGFHARQMFGEKRTGKFHREKLVLLARRALRRQRFILAMIEPDGVRREFRAPAASSTKPWPSRFRHSSTQPG